MEIIMNEEQTIPQPQPRGGQQKWPDFSEEQKAILLEIANTPAYQSTRGYAWRLAFKEHPEWEQVLLKDQDRPMSHLWHASKELQRGRAPMRPFYKETVTKRRKKRNVELVVVKRGKYKKRAKWPGVEAMNRKRAEMKAAKVAAAGEQATRPSAALPTGDYQLSSFCPHCGSHRSHFGNQA
jgi:hypothetical protein